MGIREMLEENGRRLEEIGREYDPVTGDATDPGRERVFSPEGNVCYVPKSLLSEYDQRQISALSQKEFHKIRCRHDFPYWAATCCYIKRKGGGEDILFRLNRPQRKLVAALEEMRLAQKPIRLILLKARQWGGSTCTQLYMAWLQLVGETGLNSLIVAQQHSATAEIKDMFMRMIERYPEEMLEGG